MASPTSCLPNRRCRVRTSWEADFPPTALNLGVSATPRLTHSDGGGTTASTVTSDVGLFTVFMQFLDQPTPSTTSRDEHLDR